MRAEEIDTWIWASGRLWFDAGWDPVNGGFYEHLKSDGTPNAGEDRRVRVQLRQIFSISFARHHGYIDFAEVRLDDAISYVWNKLWGADGVPGFPHIITSQGDVVDPRRDTYDHAFAMMAFGWAYRTTGAAHVREKLDAVVEFVESQLRHHQSGFKESLNAETPRRQNPHMHCFEAYMSLFEATKDAQYLSRATELFELFEKHFWDGDAGVVREYFADDWGHPGSVEQWETIEPGHMAEWVWLLREFQRLSDRNVEDRCATLLLRCLELGLASEASGLWDSVTPDGAVLEETRRLWPQTELLKAHLAQLAAGHNEHLAQCASSLRSLCSNYLDGCIDGGWLDQRDANGHSLKDLMPASTHYHLLIALHAARQSAPLMTYVESQSCPV